jgi:hypothetical protein
LALEPLSTAGDPARFGRFRGDLHCNGRPRYICQGEEIGILADLDGAKPMARKDTARKEKEYDDIPGTVVFDAERSRQGFGITCFACR